VTVTEFLLPATRVDELPRALPDRPRVRARIKARPEDFEVEEVPIYPPTGEGTHLFLWVEKRDCSGGDLLRRLGAALRISSGDIGAAGTKDRRAITRQWLSVPAECEERLAAADQLDNIRVLKSVRHDRKLRLGHLLGNRFRILLRGADPALAEDLAETGRQLEATGFPNFFGVQRFGTQGETLTTGLRLLQNGGQAGDDAGLRRLGHFERRMVISAVQSALFNRCLEARLAALEGLKRPCEVHLRTDSLYLKDGMTKWLEGWKKKGWKTADKKPVKNIDLWQRLDTARERHNVSWYWVRGHDGHELNEAADALARAAIPG